jgi:hypothetical protein
MGQETDMPTIQVSAELFQRLQDRAEPLVDTVEDVLWRLLDERDSTPDNPHQQKGRSPMQAERAILKGFQRELWELVVCQIPTTRFTLRDVYARQHVLRELRPHVRELEASIRGALEKLRDKGLIEFVDNNGTYRKLA